MDSNSDLPLAKKFILLINEERGWSPIHETEVSSYPNTQLTDDEIKNLKKAIDDYRTQYGDVIDELSIDCAWSE